MKSKKILSIFAICLLVFISAFSGFLLGYKVSVKSANYQPTTKFSTKTAIKATQIPVDYNIIANVSQEVMPWIVNIKIEYDRSLQPNIPEPIFPFNPFPDFGKQPNSKLKIRILGGSGIILSKDGYILTNDHVIKNAKNISVSLNNGQSYPAKIVGVDDITDIAVLKIDEKNLPVANIGDSSKVRLGEWVIAVGSPLGFDHTVTQGIVSAINRRVKDIPASVDFIQTDAAINPGNSGGPLINLSGQVIGINTAIRADAQNIGFSIPINTAINIADQLIKNGHISRPWVGIEMGDIQAPFGNFDLEFSGIADGVRVKKVWPKSPAEKAGIIANDLIIKVDKFIVNDSRDVQKIVRSHRIGDKVKFEIKRDNKTIKYNVLTEKLPTF